MERTTDPLVRSELVRLGLHHSVSTGGMPAAPTELDRRLAGELPDAAREA